MRKIGEGLLVLGIPLSYALNLWLVSRGGDLRVDVWLQMVGLVAGLLGILLWIGSYFSLGRGFGILPRVQKRTRRGLYAFIRHPMYLGILLTFGGLSIANQSKRGLIFTLVFMLPFLVFRAVWEEKRLLRD